MGMPFSRNRRSTPVLSRVLAGRPAPRPTPSRLTSTSRAAAPRATLLSASVRRPLVSPTQLNRPTLSGLPAVVPDPPSLKRAQTAARQAAAPEQKRERPWYLSGFENVLDVFRMPFQTAKALPVFVGKAGQTVAGLGEMLFDVPLNALDPDLYKSRFEQDLERARAEGKGTWDKFRISTQRVLPLLSDTAESIRQTGGRVAELASGGSFEFGQPGIDYFEASKRGDVVPVLFEDVGNVILGGRLAGAGNVGVRAGNRITAAGRPQLGSAVSTVGRFVEEPIGTTTRGIARGLSPTARAAAARAERIATSRTGRLGRTAGYLAPKLERAGETYGAMAESPTPLMTGALRSSARFRSAIDTNLAKLDKQIYDKNLEAQKAREEGRVREADILATKVNRLTKRRSSRQNLGATIYGARKAQQEATFLEDIRRTGLVAPFDRFTALGAVPDSVDNMRAQAQRLRQDAENPVTANPQEQIARAEMLERMAAVKEANPEKLLDVDNRRVNFEASIIVNSKLVDQIMVDLQRGLTVDEIASRIIQPRELVPQSAGARYRYTPEGIQRAIDFVQGKLDDVDRLEMDVASQMLNVFSEQMRQMATTPGTFVTGILTPAQFGDTPIPEFVLSTLSGRSYENAVLRVLDETTVRIVEEGFPDLLAQLDDARLEKPEGLFAEYATMRQDSREYQAAYLGLARAAEAMSDPVTSVFRDDPRVATQVAEFFNDPAIYAARMRPMLTYRQSARQVLRGEDVQVAVRGLRQLADDFPEVIPSSRTATIQKLVDALATNPNLAFDRAFYVRLQNTLDSVLRDVTRNRKGTAGRLEKIDARQIEIEQRLSEIRAQAQAAAGMVEQALLRPEELTARQAGEAQAMRAEAARLESEAGRLGGEPSQIAKLRTELDSQSTRRDGLETKRAEAEVAVRDSEAKLAAEESVLRQATQDAQQMVVFLSELDAAVELRNRGVGREPLPAEQKTWKQEQIAARQAEVDVALGVFESLFPSFQPGIIRREDFWSEDIWVPIKRAIPNSRHFKEFFQRYTTSKYEGVPDRIPTKAEMRVVDTNVGKPLKRGPSSLDEIANDMPRGPMSEGDWVLEVGQAWTQYMEAVDRLKEMERKPFKSDKSPTVKDEMMQERAGDLEQEAWMNPVTGQTEYGVRSLETLRRIEQMLADTEAFAAQVDQVNRLRQQRDSAARQLQEVRQQIADLDASTRQLSDRINEQVAASPQAEAGRLRSQARQLSRQADELEQATVRDRPRLAQERITITADGRRMRLATPRRLKGKEIVGYEFTKGVARKLDAAETAQLRDQQKLHQQTLELRAKLNEQDNAIFGGEQVRQQAGQYQESLSMPSGRAILQGTDRPRLLGETDQPTWIPVGEAAGVFPVSRAEKRITTEGLAPQQIASFERQRTGTIMPLDPGQFARRVSEILNEAGRNRAVNKIITDQMYASDVQTVLTPETVEALRADAERAVRDDGIPRSPSEMNTAVQREFGTRVMDELDRLGFEAVFRGDVADPSNPYAGGQPVGDLLGRVTVSDIEPTTLVMKKGLREAINTDFSLPGASKLPPIAANVIRNVIEKTAQWKAMVLPFSLRWFVGDGAGIVILSHVRGGIDPASLSARIIDVTNRMTGGEGLRPGDLKQPLFGEAIADPVISAMVGAGLQTASIRTSEIIRSLPANRKFVSPVEGTLGRFMPRFRQSSFNVNENMNGMGRSAVAIEKLTEELNARGRSIDEIDPVTVHNDPVLYEALVDAVRSANEALGQFSKLTPTEKQFMRTIYPFWSWMRFINSAAAQLILTNPDRVLFYAHLGSIALGDDADEFYGWLNKQVPIPTPFGPMLVDLSFLNPYSDAVLFAGNPLEAGTETATGISPVIEAVSKTGGELAYGAFGRAPWPLTVSSRPGYLEGRPGETTRTFGDVLGGIGYQNFRTFAGPFRFLTEVAPTWRVPGTDVLLGPGPRYPQGSPRTTGTYSRPLLSPTQQRIQAVLRGGGIPTASASLEQARLQAAEQRRSGVRSLRRRQRERRLSRIGR